MKVDEVYRMNEVDDNPGIADTKKSNNSIIP